jgi:hypothetical protein
MKTRVPEATMKAAGTAVKAAGPTVKPTTSMSTATVATAPRKVDVLGGGLGNGSLPLKSHCLS